MELKKEHIIKSNNLIECSYNLTLMEQRLINLACKKLKPMFIDKNVSIEEFKRLAMANLFEDIEIGVPEYKNEFNVKSNNIYAEMDKATSSLFEKKITYYDEEGFLVEKRWVITSKYNKSTKKVRLKFHPDLLMDLLIFKGRYTKLNCTFLSTVKSFYSARLYELLRQYLNIGSRSFEVEELRFKFNLMDGEYPKYSNFKQKILTPSIKWINENSDIAVELEEIKKGRKVNSLKFNIVSKDNIGSPKKVAFIEEFENESENTAYHKIKNIVNIPLTAGQIESICDSAINGLKNNNIKDVRVLDYIEEKWNITMQYSKNRKDVNLIGFLLAALRSNYESPKKVAQMDLWGGEQRNYSEEEWDDIEKRLLGWNDVE